MSLEYSASMTHPSPRSPSSSRNASTATSRVPGSVSPKRPRTSTPNRSGSTHLVHDRAIPHRKDGSRLLFRRSDLDRWSMRMRDVASASPHQSGRATRERPRPRPTERDSVTASTLTGCADGQGQAHQDPLPRHRQGRRPLRMADPHRPAACATRSTKPATPKRKAEERGPITQAGTRQLRRPRPRMDRHVRRTHPPRVRRRQPPALPRKPRAVRHPVLRHHPQAQARRHHPPRRQGVRDLARTATRPATDGR